jgi:hypothetical protein
MNKYMDQERKSQKCRHFRSIMDGKSCHAGVVYSSLGNYKQRPCHGDAGDGISVCEKHEPYTAEEIAQENAKLSESMTFTLQALSTIRKLEGDSGEIQCPKCNEALWWRRAFNGHVHGRCSTESCLCWMQ